MIRNVSVPLAHFKLYKAVAILCAAMLLAWFNRLNGAEEHDTQMPASCQMPVATSVDTGSPLRWFLQRADASRESERFKWLDQAATPTNILPAQGGAPDTKPAPGNGDGKADGKEKAGGGGKKFDPAVVAAGQAAFERSCTTCHNAARSLERTKDLASWRATVQRMAAKRGADIASSDIEPIAVYLASRGAAATETSDEQAKTGAPAAAPASDTSSVSTFATISPLWRGSNKDRLQNSGFAPLAWVGASWQSKIVSARATLCISCHGVGEQAFLNRVEIVEAALRVDLSSFLEPCCKGLKGAIDAGRFVVPFGAFSSQVNPGVYRTVSTPLIFNMGQRVFAQDLGVPVLPMPYASTGVDFNFDVPLGNCGSGPITASTDAYLINGLAGSAAGINWLQSRDLLDNNNRAAYGGRLTVGDPYIRAGASIMGGRFDDPADPAVPRGPLNYLIYGFDLQARYKRLFRCQMEYARRDSDRVGLPTDATAVFSERVDGVYLEVEVRPSDDCKVSFLARQDFLRVSSPVPPPGSTLLTGSFTVERFTVGINIELWHQSLLMFNFERWLVPETPNAVNVYGVRYTATF
jgi:hypothetical protein